MRFLLQTLSLVLMTALVSCSSSQDAATDRIRIGAVWSLTGPGSALDIPGKLGAELAVKQLNQTGVLGRQIELVTIDAQSDSAVASTAVRAAINSGDNLVAFLGLNDTDPAIGAGKAAQEAGLPFMTAGATYPKLPEMVGHSMFLACFGDNAQAAAAAEYAIDTMKAMRAYVMYNGSTTYTTALKSYFRSRFEELGGIITVERSYNDGATSIEQILNEVQLYAVDVIYAAAVPEDVLNIVRKIRSVGVTTPIMGGDGFDTKIIEDSLTAAETSDLYFTTHAFIDPSAGPMMSAFISDYTAENGSAPTSAFAPLGYDAMMILAKAIEDAGSTAPADIISALEKVQSFETLTGTVSYTSTAHVPHKSVTVIRVQDGKYTRAAEFLPRRVPAP